MYSGIARPTYDDVNLLLKLYDLRREDRLREGVHRLVEHAGAGRLRGVQQTRPRVTLLLEGAKYIFVGLRVVVMSWLGAALRSRVTELARDFVERCQVGVDVGIGVRHRN